MADERPNILVITTDQQRGDCLGIEGHPVLQTPYLDWVAASGPPTTPLTAHLIRIEAAEQSNPSKANTCQQHLKA